MFADNIIILHKLVKQVSGEVRTFTMVDFAACRLSVCLLPKNPPSVLKHNVKKVPKRIFKICLGPELWVFF